MFYLHTSETQISTFDSQIAQIDSRSALLQLFRHPNYIEFLTPESSKPIPEVWCLYTSEAKFVHFRFKIKPGSDVFVHLWGPENVSH